MNTITAPYIFSSTCSGMSVSSQMPTTMNTIMTAMILPNSRQFTCLMFSTAKRPHAKKPIAFKIDTVGLNPKSVVPTGMANMLPAKPVTACTV